MIIHFFWKKKKAKVSIYCNSLIFFSRQQGQNANFCQNLHAKDRVVKVVAGCKMPMVVKHKYTVGQIWYYLFGKGENRSSWSNLLNFCLKSSFKYPKIVKYPFFISCCKKTPFFRQSKFNKLAIFDILSYLYLISFWEMGPKLTLAALSSRKIG